MDDKNQTPITEEPIGGDVPVTESDPGLTATEPPSLAPEVEPPAPADNVIPFGAAGADLPNPEEDTREPWEKTQDELNAENQKPKRGRPPKEEAEQTGP